MLGSNLVYTVWRRGWPCIIWRRWWWYTTLFRFGVGLHSVLRLRLIVLVVVLLLVVLMNDWRSRLWGLRRSAARVESRGWWWNLLWSRGRRRTLSRWWWPFRSGWRRSVGLLRGVPRQGFALGWGVDHNLGVDAVLAVRIINIVRGHSWVSRPGWWGSCPSRTVQRGSILRWGWGPLWRGFPWRGFWWPLRSI